MGLYIIFYCLLGFYNFKNQQLYGLIDPHKNYTKTNLELLSQGLMQFFRKG